MKNKFRRAFCGALCVGVLLVFSGCRETLLEGLSDERANSLRLLLAERGLDASKVPSAGGWALEVPNGEMLRALRELERSRAMQPSSGAALTETSGILQSPEERGAVEERRLALQLEDTLERMPHVLEARVHLHRPLSALETVVPGSAAVLLITDGLVEQHLVQQLVSGATGVLPAQVAVVLSDSTDSGARHIKSPVEVAAADESPAPKEDLLPTTLPASAWALTAAFLAAFLAQRAWRRRKFLRASHPEYSAAEAPVPAERVASPTASSAKLSPFEMNGHHPLTEEGPEYVS